MLENMKCYEPFARRDPKVMIMGINLFGTIDPTPEGKCVSCKKRDATKRILNFGRVCDLCWNVAKSLSVKETNDG